MINKDFVRFGGGGESLMTPLGLALLAIAGLLILTVNRKYLIAPLLVAGICIPMSQRVVLAGLHFTVFRILMACAWARIAAGFIGSFRPNRIDKAVILWSVSGALTFIILWANMDALVNRMGTLYDCFGIYFLLRALLKSDEAVDRAIKVLGLTCCILGACMLVEQIRGVNIFYVFGGVNPVPDTREGHIRAQGPFAHEILAGCFGATLMPLFVGSWWQKKSKIWAAIGMLGATTITFSSFSSTAIMAWAAGLGALCMWPLRRWMRVFRWGIVLTLVALHMVMKAPVWALIGRIDLAGGSSGDHRFELVNQTILHFWEWWLVGEKTTYQWGYNLWDTANTYVETAVTGGLCTLILLIVVIVLCYQALGKMRRSTKEPGRAKWSWTLGSTMFAHLIAFIGITYYDQTIVIWYLLLAMICVATAPGRAPRSRAQAKQPDPVAAELAVPTAALNAACL